MRFRNSRVRTKVTALLVSLAALWAFAAWVTVRDGVTLLWVATLNKEVVEPSQPLLTELQRERRVSVVYLGASEARSRRELDAQRARTDVAVATFGRLARGDDVGLAASAAFERRLGETFKELDGLRSTRSAVDAGRMDSGEAASAITGVIDSIYRMYDSLASLDDEQITKDARVNIAMNRAREMLAQEDALFEGVLAAGRFDATQPAEFAQLVGAQRSLTAQTLPELPAADLKAYQDLAKSRKFVRLGQLEDLVMQNGRSLAPPPVTAEQWTPLADAVLAARDEALHTAGEALIGRGTSVGIGIAARLLLAGVLGLIAVIASVILSITTARALVRQLEKLRTAALELANDRLPGVVARLAQGEKVDVEAEAPLLDFGGDVIGQVGAAFNAVQQTAIRTAVEEAQLRQSIRDILLSLARRTQSLVHRQLTLLDVMERRETDPAELKDLFRIDHLATRMRRNAENLIVLSGASPARAWRRSVPMVDVVRGALAEVEDYTRVTVLPMGQIGLTGRAVGDVIHLLAELIENAVSFSPPYTMVQVGGQQVASGYALEIEDRGLGMSPEDLAATNERIADPPEFNLSSTARLGLYVVSRLAERHEIRVSLKASPYGGTTAVVLLPREVVIDNAEALPDQEEENVRKIALVGAPEAPAASEAPEARIAPEAPAAPGAQVMPLERPAPAHEPASSAPPASFTPSGLPFRVPQASLAPSLAEEPPASADDDEDERSPDDIRKIMGSFQTGTRRGRSEAARLLGEGENTR
ncbi:nitrate- and nitrite sensing domain-containing protein [Planotetraspora sp. A-T 1434]|uniref:sensor histidine kinase n=1 Tax=Planotetraspora sp. A-T 1434 TaxID=2979219 RepID=UPI0021BF014E|nr:nitrate- and nitrite sensing domain-containing protein [Planotetraspora sp. A-T 1434]MCT9933259.1 nitrate- and nitrite sensing domain-containing protein [Planotetraspora sp. A-T 1434]